MPSSRRKIRGLLVMLGLFASWPAWASPTLKIISPPPKVTVNEPFTLQINLDWPASEGPYEVRAENPLFENLELLTQGQSEETGGEQVRVTVTLALRAVKPGEGRILPFEILYRKPDLETWERLPVAGQKVLIVAAFPWRILLIVLSTFLGAMTTVLGLVAFMKFRKFSALKNTLRPPDPKQRVYVHAEETILTYKGETQKETIDRWASEIKQVVVTYYDLPSKTATGPEILALLKTRDLSSGEFTEISRLFAEVESLKFMPRNLPVREMETLQKTLLQYVRGKIIIENSLNG